METRASQILEGLNPAQRDAVVNYDSPSLIIAGAGSGKTRVLTSRIAYMIEQGVKPYNILALTFTNKAAEQMRDRIAQMMPDGSSRYIRMGTFHSVFARILRENAEKIGFPEAFTIYEPSDVKHLLKEIVSEMHLDPDKYKPNRLASRISYAKNCLVTPGAYLGNTIYATEDRNSQIPEFGNIYNTYCKRCKANGAMDFDDLLLQTNVLLRDCADVLARYQEQFQYILVDEYQDTNYAQYIIIRRLSQHHSKVCVVGDDAQSIYSFRGAKIENILSFKKDYPTAKVFKLEQNYRSTRTIVDAANSVIVKNSHRMDKTCFSEGDVGDKIRVIKSYTDREEADLVVSALRDKVRSDSANSWSDAVVLYRTNNQSKAIEDNLRRRGIPYRIYRGQSFYDHKEVKDLMAYIRLVINPRDDEAFTRIINYPARGIGATTVERITAIAREKGVSMWESVDTLVSEPAADAVQKAIARKVTEFVKLIRELSLSRTEKGLYEFGLDIANRSGILPLYRQERAVEARSALDNIEELLNTMQDFKERCDAEIRSGERDEGNEATIEEWLQNVMLLTDMDNEDPDEQNKVTLMTVHAAKGLEFKYVFIVGMEDKLFPSQMAMESMEGLEEERRLFYVALTRAKVSATLSYAEMRYKWGNMEFSHPSRFLDEIDPRYLDREDEAEGAPAPADESRLSAVEQLRRRYDYRMQEKLSSGGQSRGYGAQGGYGSRPAQQPRDGESGKARFFRSSPGVRPASGGGAARTAAAPASETTSRVSTEGLKRIPSGIFAAGNHPSSPSAGGYEVGERVSHPKFGAGVILSIEAGGADNKLVVDFESVGEKTLLAKFAKLTKL